MAEHSVDPFLTALLGALLPGSGDWLPAGQTQVAAFVAKRASELPGLSNALAELRAVLSADFASRDFASQIEVLREAEARIPEVFAQIVVEAYRGYYTDARVLALIESKTGYCARPPQPLGRKVQPSDWSVLNGRGIAPAPRPTLLDTSEKLYDR